MTPRAVLGVYLLGVVTGLLASACGFVLVAKHMPDVLRREHRKERRRRRGL